MFVAIAMVEHEGILHEGLGSDWVYYRKDLKTLRGFLKNVRAKYWRKGTEQVRIYCVPNLMEQTEGKTPLHILFPRELKIGDF